MHCCAVLTHFIVQAMRPQPGAFGQHLLKGFAALWNDRLVQKWTLVLNERMRVCLLPNCLLGPCHLQNVDESCCLQPTSCHRHGTALHVQSRAQAYVVHQNNSQGMSACQH